MDIAQRLELAATSQDKLRSMHAKFLEHVGSLTNTIKGGSFSIVNSNLSAVALNFAFDVKRRFVQNKKDTFAAEYAFFHNEKDCYLCLYLNEFGYFYTDPEFSNKLGEFTDHDIHSKVVAALSNALLNSPMFAPQKIVGSEAT
jgi:hypothetical protein